MAASLISPWLLWWPPAESHYNIYDHSVVGYVSHAHSIVLLYSVGNKITTTTQYISALSMKVATRAWQHLRWKTDSNVCIKVIITQIAKFMGPTWGPPGTCRPQMGPMLAPWTLLSGKALWVRYNPLASSLNALDLALGYSDWKHVTYH